MLPVRSGTGTVDSRAVGLRVLWRIFRQTGRKVHIFCNRHSLSTFLQFIKLGDLRLFTLLDRQELFKRCAMSSKNGGPSFKEQLATNAVNEIEQMFNLILLSPKTFQVSI